MATTSLVTSYRSAGQPDDAVGSIGDTCFDTTNRITWVKQSGNTWVGGAYSNIGPTGPSQLNGTGAPTSGLGQIGNGYTDLASGLTYLKSSSGWSQVGSIIGPTGPNGPSLSGLSAAIGPYAVAASVTLSSTPYVLVTPGSTTASVFVPVSASAFMGFYAYSSVAATLTLYDATAGAAVYSYSIAAGASYQSGYFSLTQYPLIQGHTYQWQATGSASAIIQLEPYYATPANSVGLNVGISTAAGYSANQAFSSTAIKPPPLGLTSAFGTWSHTPIRTAGVYSAVATYTPASGTAATASVTPVLNYALLTNGTGGAVGITFAPVTATGLPQTLLTPRITDTSSLTSGYFFFWTLTGSGTGTFSITLLPLV